MSNKNSVLFFPYSPKKSYNMLSGYHLSFFSSEICNLYWINKDVVQKVTGKKLVTVKIVSVIKHRYSKCRRSLGRLLKYWQPIEVQPQLQTLGTDVRVRQYCIVLDGKNWSTILVHRFENRFSIWVVLFVGRLFEISVRYY